MMEPHEVALILMQNTLFKGDATNTSAEATVSQANDVPSALPQIKIANSDFNPPQEWLHNFYNTYFSSQPICQMAQPQLTVETVPTPSNPTTVPPDAQAESESCQNDYQTFKDYIETYSHILFHNFNRTIPLPDEDQPKTFTEYVDEAKLILTEHILEEKRKQLTEENPLSIRKPKFKPSAEVWFQRWRSTWLYLLKKKIQHKKALAELEFLKLAIPILEEAITICNDAKQFLTDELVLKNPDAYAQFLRQCGH